MNAGPNPLGIVSLVFGVLALLSSCCGVSCCGAIPEFLFATIGIVTGFLAITQPSDPDAPPDNLPKIGIGLSIAGIVLWFVIFVVMMALNLGGNVLVALLGN